MNGFWSTLGPFPTGQMDPDAILNMTFDWGPWVTSAGTGLSLASVSVIDAAAQLNVGPATLEGSRGTHRVQASSGGSTVVVGQVYRFTLRATLSDGQRDDRTFALKIRQR